MNDESTIGGELVAEVADLKREVAGLRQIVTLMLSAILLLTIALNAVFFWQSRAVRRQLSAARAELNEYQRAAVPAMDEFLNRLERFAAAHPDFAPILGKYAPARTNALRQGVPRSTPR